MSRLEELKKLREQINKEIKDLEAGIVRGEFLQLQAWDDDTINLWVRVKDDGEYTWSSFSKNTDRDEALVVLYQIHEDVEKIISALRNNEV